MAKRTKNDVKKELNVITDTLDYDHINDMIEKNGMLEGFSLSKKTLNNIASWALDGKSQFEIAHNLELTPNEWKYLCKICPTILLVMQHSTAYADIVVAGSLYQTAIGGYTIKKKIPIKIKDYDDGRVIGEHIEYAEYDEVQPPNANLLKYLAEHKLSENFGSEKVDNSAEYRGIIDTMTEEQRRQIEEMSDN